MPTSYQRLVKADKKLTAEVAFYKREMELARAMVFVILLKLLREQTKEEPCKLLPRKT